MLGPAGRAIAGFMAFPFMDPRARDLLRMRPAQLDELFARLPPGPIPNGPAAGTALIATGTFLAAPIAQFVRAAAWQGKTFDAQRGSLVNRLTPLGLPAVRAAVYEAPSRHDGRACIVLDYSKTSLAARFVRDEIRALAPGYYLGKAYVFGVPILGFALQF